MDTGLRRYDGRERSLGLRFGVRLPRQPGAFMAFGLCILLRLEPAHSRMAALGRRRENAPLEPKSTLELCRVIHDTDFDVLAGTRQDVHELV